MKHLIIAFISVLLASNYAFAQFVVTPNGLEKTDKDGTDYYIIEVPNSSQSDLFKKTLQFITETYISPQKVISSQVENETIGITALHTIFYDFDVHYKIIFRFKDGRVRFDTPTIISMKKIQDGKEMHLTFTKTMSATSSIWLFNNKGELRGMLIPNYKTDIEHFFNSIYNKYSSFMTKNAGQEDDDNW